MHTSLSQALSWRYATRVFDPSKKISDDDLQVILEAGRLAPSSFGTEPWKFLVVENPEIRAKLREVGFGQPKITDASHLIVIARRTDARERMVPELIERTARIQGVDPTQLEGLRGMVEGAVTGRNDAELDTWVRCQTYLALGFMLEAAAMLGIDAGPMEGFVPGEVDAILGLAEKHLASTSMVALGYRGQDAAAQQPKVRRTVSEVVEFVR